MADDTTLFVQDISSIKILLEVLYAFSRSSGLKLDKEKTISMWIGSNRYSKENPLGLKWVEEQVCALGIIFNTSETEMEKLNFIPRLKKMKRILNMWAQRDLLIKGKITVLKSLAISQLLYPCAILAVPEWLTKAVDAEVYKFLWSNKPNKIKRETIIGKIKDGGMKMIDFDSMVRAQKATWMKRLMDGKDSAWKSLFMNYFPNDVYPSDLVLGRFSLEWLNPNIPKFYRQVLIYYDNITLSSSPVDGKDIIMEKLWHNKFITKGQSEPFFNKDMFNHGIKQI